MQFTVSASRDLQKIARNPGKMIRVRTHQRQGTSKALGITAFIVALSSFAAAARRPIMQKLMSDPRRAQRVLKPVAHGIEKSERVILRAAEGFKEQIKELDLSPEMKRHAEKGIAEIEESLQRFTQEVAEKVDNLADGLVATNSNRASSAGRSARTASNRPGSPLDA